MGALLRQLVAPAVDCELEKLTQTARRASEIGLPLAGVADACNDLKKHLRKKSDQVQDREDLIELRLDLSAISKFTALLSDALAEGAPGWPVVLVRDCYERLGIDQSRGVLVVHNQRMGVNDFGVYVDVLNLLRLTSFIQPTNHRPLDIYVIPAEAKHDPGFIALLGHEVGHVFWQQLAQRRLIQEALNSTLSAWPQPEDLFEQARVQEVARMMVSHVEELLCDYIGRMLFGPAFNVALIRLFQSLPGGDEYSKTHPAVDERIRLSSSDLETYCKLKSKCAKLLQSIGDSLSKIAPAEVSEKVRALKSIEDALAGDVLKQTLLTPNIDADFLDSLADEVFPELDGIRPPFETVSLKKPKVISIQSIVVGGLLYLFDRQTRALSVCESSDSVRQNDELAITFDHVRYALSLNGIVQYANEKILETDIDELAKSSLWKWRLPDSNEERGPLIVVPSLDPKTQYSHSAIDLRLGANFLVCVPSRITHIEPSPYPESHGLLEDSFEEVWKSVGEKFILHPHQFVLASILEYVSLPTEYFGLVLGRSSWGRLGLNIATATTVQAGYRGCLTLELRNLGESPLPLTVGVRIAQLCVYPVAAATDHKGYFAGPGKYRGPTKAGIPQIRDDQDWDFLAGYGATNGV